MITSKLDCMKPGAVLSIREQSFGGEDPPEAKCFHMHVLCHLKRSEVRERIQQRYNCIQSFADAVYLSLLFFFFLVK